VKHIDIKYHFIKQTVFEKELKFIKIDGELNPADGFTKVIPSKTNSRHRATLQILQWYVKYMIVSIYVVLSYCFASKDLVLVNSHS
jgi:hypothetical protein